MNVEGKPTGMKLKSLLAVAGLGLGLVALYRSNWARKVSDTPVHLVLSMTSEFEREGRDPAKASRS